MSERTGAIDSERDPINVGVLDAEADNMGKFFRSARPPHHCLILELIFELLRVAVTHRRGEDARLDRCDTNFVLTEISRHRKHHAVNGAFACRVGRRSFATIGACNAAHQKNQTSLAMLTNRLVL